MADDVFYEDMERKGRWFFEQRGTTDAVVLDRLRDKAVAHVDVMRGARDSRLDPGGGAIKSSAVLMGAGRGARTASVSLPGHVADTVFLTAPVEVRSRQPLLTATLKQKVKRGSRLDARTARMFRYDADREVWQLVDLSGWNAAGKYVWGRVDRPGIYAAVALPKDQALVRAVALEAFARRTIRHAVVKGQFARAEDFGDVDAFREYWTDRHEATPDATELADVLKVHRQALRELKGSWKTEPLGGNPQWAVLDEIAWRFGDVRKAIDLDAIFPLWPIFWKVQDRVGPWYTMGPLNINGRVKSLAIHPTNGDILYAGAANGGVWKTTNGGGSWRSLWKFEDSMAIGAIAVAPSNGNVIYAGTGEYTPPTYGPSYGGVGLFRSSNAGVTWTNTVGAGVIGTGCTRIVVHPTNSNRVFIATNSGIYRSTNGGADATRVLSGAASDLVMAHDNPNVLYAGIWNDGVYKSVNGGTSWNRIHGNILAIFAILFGWHEDFPTGNAAGWIKLGIGRHGEDGSNFVVVKLGANSATTAISTDGGASWLKVPGSEGVSYDEWCSMVAVHPRQTRHVYIGGLNLQHSTDGWNFSSSPGSHSDHHQIMFHPTNDNTAFVACDGGVYRTNDNGASWSLSSYLLSATQLMSLGVSGSGPFVAGSATQDQGIIQTEGSYDWDDHGGGNEWGMFVVDPNDSRNIFISPGGGQLRRSTNRGASYTNPTGGLVEWWTTKGANTIAASFAHVAVKPGSSNTVVGVATLTDQIKDANGNVTATYGPFNRIYYSSNGGSAWTNVFDLPHRATRVAFSSSDPTRVYVATSQGRVYRSSASGASGWAEASTAANRPAAGNITSIAVDPANKNVVYVTSSNMDPHILRSTDAGAHWSTSAGTVASMTLPNISLNDVVVNPENSDVLYVASDIGVFRSNDYGSTWYWANDGYAEDDLPRVLVTALALDPSTHNLYASTMGRGLYYTMATGIVSLRATNVRSKYFRGKPFGILQLRLHDGATTYTMARQEVVRRILAGTEVYTVGSDGKRARVRALPPDGGNHPIWYLSTTPDDSLPNNLLSLPGF